ncbi:MAG: antibiotic biosynthesis monooxygenase family protein [Ktedonobacterales bacterium]
MIAAMFRVKVPEQAREKFEQSWTGRAGLVDQMPGFRGLEVLRDEREVGTYIVLTHWDRREDFDHWASSPAFTAGHMRSGESGAAGGGVDFYEVLPS